MSFRHRLKQVLRPLPGFSGLFDRQDELRARLVHQQNELSSLRAAAIDLGGENEALRVRADKQVGELGALQTLTSEQSAEISTLRSELAEVQKKLDTGSTPATTQHMQWSDAPHLEKQGLFVVGHARSGTTILMRALNLSPDVYLLGEANIAISGLREGFSLWFNAMHRQFRNTRFKGAYCPLAPAENSNGIETLNWLSERYRYVGEKVAFRSETLGYDPARFFDFHNRHFHRSYYVCVFRNPLDVMKSNRNKFQPDDLLLYADSYLQTLQLIVEVAETFPNVSVLAHERVSQQAFDTIAGQLDVELAGASALYDDAMKSEGYWRDDATAVPMADMLVEAYRQMLQAFSPDTLQLIPAPSVQLLARRLRDMRREIAHAEVPNPI